MPAPRERGERALHAHRFLMRAGLSIGNVFAWIFVFEYFYIISQNLADSLIAVVLLYGLAQGITVVLTPIAAMHLRRGSKHSLIWGTVFAALAFTVLGGFFGGHFMTADSLWGVAAFAVLMGAYRALYFVPYHLIEAAVPGSAIGSPKDQRLLYELFIALLPLFAGLTMMEVSYAPLRLLFGASALLVISLLPALLLPDRHEKYSWSYLYTFQQLLRPKHSALVLHSFFDGLQGAALFLMWPLAVFVILGGSYGMLGLVFTVTLLLILLLRTVYARMLSAWKLEHSSTVLLVFAVSGWVARLAAGTPVGVIVADAYAYASLPVRGTTSDPFSYEQFTDRGAFVDEYTVLKEIALGFGRISMCFLAGLLALYFPLPIVFGSALALAAFSSGIGIALARVVPATPV